MLNLHSPRADKRITERTMQDSNCVTMRWRELPVRNVMREQIVPGGGAKGGIVRRERVTRILYTKRVAKLYTSSIRRTKRGVTTCVLLPTFFSSLLATHTNIIRRNKLLYVLPLVCNSISQVSFEYFFRHFMCVCMYIYVCIACRSVSSES